MANKQKVILKTDRLILRQFDLTDVAFILQLLNSPGWLAYIGDRGVRTVAQAEAYLMEGPMASFASNGFGLAMVTLKENGVGIGMCGLIKREGLDDLDIGYALLPEYTRKGYAFEIASATLIYAKEQLRLRQLLAITDPKNQPSIRLLEKLGFRYEQEVQLRPEDIMLNLYCLAL